MKESKIISTPMDLGSIKGKSIDYSKVYVYFSWDEILEEDKPFIYDYRRLGTKDAVASIPHSLALKYDSYKKIVESPEYQNTPWYS